MSLDKYVCSNVRKQLRGGIERKFWYGGALKMFSTGIFYDILYKTSTLYMNTVKHNRK